MNASERRAAYLDDLGQGLRSLTPVQRIEVVDSVREKIDSAATALGHEPTDGEMETILADVGDVHDVIEQAIADAETSPEPAGSPAPAPKEPEPEPEPATVVARPTEPEEKAAAPRVRTALADLPRMEWPEEPLPRPGMSKRWVPFVIVVCIALGSFFAMFIIPVVVVIIGIALLWSSPLWQRREKIIASVAPPLTIGAFLPMVVALTTIDASGRASAPTVGLIGLLLVALLGAGVLIRLAVLGLRESARLDLEHPKPKK